VKSFIARAILALLLLPLALVAPALAQAPQPRLALVLGNAEYRAGPLATAANDAGLIAETLRNAGFDVTGAANLDQDQTRRAFREFLEKTTAAGPQAVVFVYLSGRGLQFEGENYFVPVEATIPRDSDVPAQAIRVSDLTRPLAGIPLAARMVVLDLARTNNFAQSGQPLAPGLALVDPEDGSLIAFNAAPGTIAPEEQPPYGAYAQALSEMMREGGLPVDEVFSRTRLRVNELTRGAVVPWHASKITVPFVFFERAPGAPAPLVSPQARAEVARRPIRDFPAEEAYAVAIDLDTIPAYQEFLVAYPSSPQARRVRAILAARREALIWRRCVIANRPEAYWTYIRRYPRGPHIADARRRLALISAPLDPPAQFAFFEYDVPPPPPDEIEIIDNRRTYYFDERDYGPSPPAAPVLLIGPRERERDYYVPPPPPPQNRGFLPIPVGIPMPFARSVERQGGFAAPAFMPQPPRPAGQGAQPAQVQPGGAQPPPSPQPAPAPAPAPGQPGRPAQPAPQSGAAAPAPTPVPAPQAPPGAGSKPLPSGAQPRRQPGAPAAPAVTPRAPGAPGARGPTPSAAPPQPLPGAQPAQPGARPPGAPAAPPQAPAAAPKPAAPAPTPARPAAPAAPKPPPAAPKPPAAAAPAPAPHAAPPAAAPRAAPPPAPKPAPVAPKPAAPPPAPHEAPPPAAPRVAPPPAAPRAAPPPAAPPPAAVAPRPAAPPPAAPKPPPPAAAAPHPAAPAPGKPGCGAPGLPPCPH
jgi:uncharacterized caspase-like protein